MTIPTLLYLLDKSLLWPVWPPGHLNVQAFPWSCHMSPSPTPLRRSRWPLP